jgi:hypothetical protein
MAGAAKKTIVQDSDEAALLEFEAGLPEASINTRQV